PPMISGRKFLPPGFCGIRKLGPRGPRGPPGPRRGPSGPRFLNKSSMLLVRRGLSPPEDGSDDGAPPPGSHGLRGPRGCSSPPLLTPSEGVSPPELPSLPSPPPEELPQGLRLPAIASAILSICPP